MKKSLYDISRNVECLPWPFDAYEMNEMKIALANLCDRYKVILGIEKAIRDLKVARDGSGKYYLVVTDVKYLIAYVE